MDFQSSSLEYDYENYFYGARLSYPVHPSYLAMYIVISILYFIGTFFDNSAVVVWKTLWMLIISVFLVVLYLLSSRAGILAGIIIFLCYFLYKFYKKLSKWIF